MKNYLRVKLFGEAFIIHKLEIDSSYLPLFQKAANMFKEPLHSAILNVEFFNVLGIDKLQSFNDVIKYTFSGLINNYKNNVEISYGRKRIAKFQLEELFRQQTLFPLYRTEVAHISTDKLSPGIYVEELEIGLIGKYEIVVEKFNVELLKFHLTKIQLSNIHYELLNYMSYDNRKLTLVKSDTLLRNQSSLNNYNKNL